MAHEITAIISVPSSIYSNTIVVITTTGIFRVNNGGWTRINVGNFTNPATYYRWAFAVNERDSKIYFTNPANYVRSTDGSVLDAAVAGVPGGRYLEVFFDHLMVGHTYESGNVFKTRVRWSDIYDFNLFTVTPSNEADYYDFNEPESEAGFNRGITGMKRLGQGLAVYTPRTIYMMQYEGLPNIMRVDPVVTGLGCPFPYALASVNRLHFFPSDENFYVFDGISNPQPIGDEIKDYFFADLNTDSAIRDQTWSYVNTQRQEIWWVYVNTTSTSRVFNRAVVYNYRERLWFTASVENVHSYGYVGNMFRTIDQLTELSTSIDGLTGEIDRLGITNKDFLYAWGSADGKMLQEEVSTDLIANLETQTLPFLETGDKFYGSIEGYKEVDTLIIHSEYSGSHGIEVQYSVRDHLNDAVVWQTVPTVWTPSLREHRISLPRVAGRIFRFRFRPREVQDGVTSLVRTWKFHAWAECVHGEQQDVEK